MDDNDGNDDGDQDLNWTSDDPDSDGSENSDANSNDDEDADGCFFPMDKPGYHTYIADLMRFVHRRQTPYPKTCIAYKYGNRLLKVYYYVSPIAAYASS